MELITIEVRSRIRSCNIFILTRDILEKSSIQLKLKENVIILRMGSQIKFLPLNFIKIIPKTLSSLTVTDNWISLRVQTQPIEGSYGSFKTEIVATPGDSTIDFQNNPINIEHRLKERNCCLRCSRCKNDITNVVFFKRVLPLPSNICEPSEWFCCNHDGSDYSVIPYPRESDCFYERNYRLLNKAIFKKELKIDEDSQTVTCNRCLSTLGGHSTYKDSIKIWNCCVEFKFSDDESDIEKASDPLQDFISIVSNRTDIFTGNRILVETLDGERSHYLILQVMDKNLELLIEKDCAMLSQGDTIELASSRVTKLLYKYTENETEMKRYCVDTERCQVALPVMMAAVDHLSSSTKRYPPSYRIIDKYFVGFVYL
ncbi:uncharacterized protein [Neodiprion pinetum]|uniref:uncharacterized protein n=1 Tax=Neodiprion pinetum TaxID=441929 RepID=UPI001EDF9543|nr:uncharacterized protein LOC124222769 [Neodiprion pinetum]